MRRHEREDTADSYRALLEARCAFLAAELAAAERRARIEKRRSAEIGRRLKEARSAERDREREALKAQKLVDSVRPRRRVKASAGTPLALPLLEGVGG